MSNYIEFIHEQSNTIISDTFDNVSINDRIYTFNIITKDFLIYEGSYNLFLYEDDTKTTLLDQGKCYLNTTQESTIYIKEDTEKIIYNG